MDSPAAPLMSLSVVIVNWNGAELLGACLESLVACAAEVIVVDNGSSDRSRDLLASSFPGVRTILNENNIGFAAASNQGIRLATAPLVLLLNNDTVANCAAFDQLAAFFASHPAAGIAGPSLVYPDGRRQRSAGPGPNLWTELLSKTLLHRALPGIRERAPQRTSQVDWVTGAALCIRRELALEVGGLEEAMFMFYEDLDLCARVREAGWEVWFVATTPITHLGGATRRMVEAESLVHSFQSADVYFSRHGPAWRRTLLRVMTVPEMWLRMAVWSTLSASPHRRGLARDRLRAYRRILGLALIRTTRRV